MVRRFALACLVLLAGCQSYNFNPVGKCVIQPGATRFKVSAVDTADLLFVVDDSGSMAASQANLARNFTAFIDELAKTQKDRASRGLQPLDFHVAITTSAVYENLAASGAVCAAADPAPVCTYRTAAGDQALVSHACTTPGEACGDFVTSYYGTGAGGSHAGCVPGVGAEGRPYPAGDFVAAPGNPKVLHFTKDLGWATWGTAAQDARLTDLVARFEQNIAVGTCGSGQEQHLEAARLAIDKALRRNGKAQPADVAASEFPHEGAKLVVVYVGDEDDCSGPADPATALVAGNGLDLQDACVQDWLPANRARSRQTPISDYATQLLGLGRPVGAAFISSAVPDATGTLRPGLCGCPAGSTDPALCAGKSTGTRLHELASALEAGGAGVVRASVCDASFATTLKSIAELVKPPAGLRLPTQPAAGEVTVLRIVGTDGRTARQCRGPGADADWWFVDCDDTSGAPVQAATSCLAIRSGSTCEANPGESYSAEYLGLVPEGGCGAAAAQSSECAGLLGGRAQDWSCEVPVGQARGTCLCNASAP